MLNKLIDTIKYYLAVLWLKSPIYTNIISSSKILVKLINDADDVEHAKNIINMKAFKYISKSYKNKLIYNKFRK